MPSEDMLNRIIIGIGGQGSKIVDNIARKLQKSGNIPNNEEFMIIDTDDATANKCESIKPKYKKILSRPELILMKDTNKWLPDAYAQATGAGCGQHRVYGRAMYNVHKESILTTIGAAASDLRNRTGSDDYVIILCNALGGGTGSSMMIDIAIDIRDWMIKQFGHDPVIFGIGMLPSSKEAVLPSGNAYASLKELHFLMSHKKDTVVGDKNYSNPFKIFFLLGRDLQGQNRDVELENATTRFLLDLGFVPGSALETEGKWLDLNDLQNRAIDYQHRFATLGYYECTFPIDTLFKYYEIEDYLPIAREKMVAINAKIIDEKSKIESKKTTIDSLLLKRDSLLNKIHTYQSEGGWFGKVNKGAIRNAKSVLDYVEQTLSKIKEEVFQLELRLGDIEEEYRIAEKSIDKLVALKNSTLRSLVSPNNTKSFHQIVLTEDEIKSLKQKREDLKRMSFLEIMRTLNREKEYYKWTHEPIEKASIIFNPLLNYRHSIGNGISSDYISILRDYDIITQDSEGNIVSEEEKFGHFIAVLSTRSDNFEHAKLSDAAFRNSAMRLSKDAEVVLLNTPARQHSFAIYTLMLGLQPWSPAPGLPPRLMELDWLGKAYESNESLAKLQRHHSMLYGTPKTFSVLTGIPYVPGDDYTNTAKITQFWKDYEIFEDDAKWNNVPLVLAQSIKMINDLLNGLTIADTILEAIKIPDKFSSAILAVTVQKLSSAKARVNKLDDWIKTTIQAFSELKNNLDLTITQISNIKPPTNVQKEKIETMLRDTSRNIEVLIDKLDVLSDRYNLEFQKQLSAIDEFIAKIPENETSASVIRDLTKLESVTSSLREDSVKTASNINSLKTPLSIILSKLNEFNSIIESTKDVFFDRELMDEVEPRESESDFQLPEVTSKMTNK